MLRMLGQRMVMGAVQKRLGVTPAGPVSAALLTTGATLILTRGRRSLGLGLAIAGGLLLWREADRQRATGGDGNAGRGSSTQAGDPAKAPR